MDLVDEIIISPFSDYFIIQFTMSLGRISEDINRKKY